MKADAGATKRLRREEVFGLACAVREEPQAVARWCGGILLDAPANSFFGQQAGDEGEIRFTILDAETSHRDLGHERSHLVAPLPGRMLAVARKHPLDDLDQPQLLEDTIVADLRKQPGPGHHVEPVAPETAIGV